VAAVCILPNENRAKLFQAETGASKIQIVWNCPTRKEVHSPREAPGPIFRLLYHGSVVPERVPLAVIHALGRVSRPIYLKIVGYETTGSRGYLDQIRQTAATLGIPERVEIAGAVPRQELMELCATCDAGLALMPLRILDINLENMTGASNKPFDYLACGLAVLVSRLPGWRELFVNPGYGLDCDPSDPDSVAAALQKFCDHPETVRAMGERGRQRILSEWNYETQFLEVVRLLSERGGSFVPCPVQENR
jgi:glycosyltransferase involved in cell wall biosynthesis